MKLIDKIKKCQSEQELDILIKKNILRIYGNKQLDIAIFEQRNRIINK